MIEVLLSKGVSEGKEGRTATCWDRGRLGEVTPRADQRAGRRGAGRDVKVTASGPGRPGPGGRPLAGGGGSGMRRCRVASTPVDGQRIRDMSGRIGV